MNSQVLDESHVEALCSQLEEGLLTAAERNEILDNLEALLGAGSREYTISLKALYSRRRSADHSAQRSEILRYTRRLSRMAHIRNQSAKMLAEQRRTFHVELHEPLYADSLPLTFHAWIYVDDRFHGRIARFVTEQDLAMVPESNRSLSKRERENRQIGQMYQCFITSFPAYIQRQWEGGVDRTTYGQITWPDATSRHR